MRTRKPRRNSYKTGRIVAQVETEDLKSSEEMVDGCYISRRRQDSDSAEFHQEGREFVPDTPENKHSRNQKPFSS